VYIFTLSHDSHLPRARRPPNTSKVSRQGLTIKPFTNYPNKLVAVRFQRLGEWSPPSRVAHHDRNPVLTLIGKKPFCNLVPLLRLLVATNKLEKTSYMTKTIPTFILKDVRMSCVVTLSDSPYEEQLEHQEPILQPHLDC
jgi:hypothetical protein